MIVVLGAMALAAGVVLCAFDGHDDAVDRYGCLPPVLTVMGALSALPLLTMSGTATPSIVGPERSIVLDTSTPPPKARVA